MMLTVLVLVAMSAANVVFVMSDNVMRSTYDHTTLNTTDIESMYANDKSDERANEVPEFGDILRHFHPNSNKGWLAPKLGSIKRVQKTFSETTRLPHIFQSFYFRNWMKSLRRFYRVKPEVVHTVIFEILSRYFGSDHAFISALFMSKKEVGANYDNVIKKLQDLQVKKWIDDKQDEEKVFEILQLNTMDSNPLKSPVFLTWVKFVQQQHSENSNKVILDRLLSHFKNMNALVDALDGANTNTKKFAKDLLDYQYQEWKNEKKTAHEVFEILGLQPTDSESPAYSAWVGFVKTSFSDDQEAIKAMLIILGHGNKDNLDSFFTERAQSKNKNPVGKNAPKKQHLGKRKKRLQDSNLEERPPVKKPADFDLNVPWTEPI